MSKKIDLNKIYKQLASLNLFDNTNIFDKIIAYQIDKVENPVYIKEAYKMINSDESFQDLFEKAEMNNPELQVKHEKKVTWARFLSSAFDNVRLNYRTLKIAEEKIKTEK